MRVPLPLGVVRSVLKLKAISPLLHNPNLLMDNAAKQSLNLIRLRFKKHVYRASNLIFMPRMI